MDTHAETKLRPRIGFFGLLAMSVGMNIGGAVFALTTTAAGMSGPSLPLAMMISSIPALLAVVPYCMLTMSLPTTSATYRYIQLFSPALALVSSMTLIVCILIGAQPLFALAFGMYLGKIVSIDPIVAGVLVLTFFYIINVLGIGLTARLQFIMVLLLLSALCLFLIMGLPEVQPARFSDLFSKGAGGVLSAAGLLFTFSAGGLFVVDFGGEVTQAKRVFPKVLFLGILIVMALNVMIMSVVVGVMDTAVMKGKSLVHVAQVFMPGPAVLFFAVAGALVACTTTINVVFTVLGRQLMVLSEDGLLPGFIGRVSRRFGTPHFGLTVAYIVSTAALISIPSLLFFGSMLNLGLVVSITLVAVSGLLFPKRYPKLFAESTFKISPRINAIACISVIVINLMIFGFFTTAVGKATFVFLGIAMVMGLYALSRKKVLKSIDVSAVMPALKDKTGAAGKNISGVSQGIASLYSQER